MTAPCEGYACPPEHSVMSSTIIVRTEQPDLATTGVDGDLMLVAAMFAAVMVIVGIAGLIRRWVR